MESQLREEAARLESNGVDSSAGTWLNFTKLLLQDKTDQGTTTKVIKTYVYLSIVKGRAALAVKRLISLLSVFRDNSELGSLSANEVEWFRQLCGVPEIRLSQFLPPDTLGRIYTSHIGWLACVFSDFQAF